MTGYQWRIVPASTGNRPPWATPSSERAMTSVVNMSADVAISGAAAVSTLASTLRMPMIAIVRRAPKRCPNRPPGTWKTA